MNASLMVPPGGVVHARVAMRAGVLSLRDAIPSDADAYVKYWHDSGDKIKNLLRIDRIRLGAPEDSRNRFLAMIRVSTEQPRVILTITLNDEVIGYTNLNRYGPDDNYPHFHTYLHTHRRAVRSALQSRRRGDGEAAGAGVAAVAVGYVIHAYFELFPLRRLVLQTRPTSKGINRALDLYLAPVETRYIENADGLAGPGEFHTRYVLRDDAPKILERAQSLAHTHV